MSVDHRIATAAPPEAVRQDHTLVVGGEWEWNVTFPIEMLDGAHGFALVMINRANALLPAVSATPSVIGAEGKVRFSLTKAETAVMRGTTYWYHLMVQTPDHGHRELAHGRIDLMTEEEYRKSLRRISHRITIPLPRRA